MNIRTRRRRLHLATAIVVAATAALSLTACTAEAPVPTPSPTASNVTGLPDGVQQATDVPTDVPNVPELRTNVTIESCEGADAGWKAAGTAANTGAEDVDYTITVFFTTDGGTVIGTGDTTVSVAPGASEAWEITAELTPAPTTLCVLRGVG